MGEMKWVVEIKELEAMKDGGLKMPNWNKHSIYKLPACVTDLNRKAYIPRMVSFGPYHHGKEELKDMEEHKRRALLHFLKRCEKPIELLVQQMAQIVQDLRDSYEPLDTFWKEDTPRFLQLMILDGCFMLEILRIASKEIDEYSSCDPVFSEHGRLYIIPFIRRDMFILENQLPLMVLETLIKFEGNTTATQQEQDGELNRRILQFFSPGISIPSVERMGKCLHALDVYKKSLKNQHSGDGDRLRITPRGQGRRDNEIIRSATELHEAGIRFRKYESSSLEDISFYNGYLRMPVVVVDDITETMFLNLIAFERFHVGAGNEVSSFLFFIDNIIDHEKDVALMHSQGIIKNALGSDKAVASLFNSLTRDIVVDQDSTLVQVRERISHYCKKPWNKWRANLIHTYFRSPWALISLIGAFLLFGLTVLQTVYTVLPH